MSRKKKSRTDPTAGLSAGQNLSERPLYFIVVGVNMGFGYQVSHMRLFEVKILSTRVQQGSK